MRKYPKRGSGSGKGESVSGGFLSLSFDGTGVGACVLESPVTPIDDSKKAYLEAERRLRELLLGDGSTTVGLVKGEERRLLATRLLRRMRTAVEELAVVHEGGREAPAEERAADLEVELRRLASSRSPERPGKDV
jgi:hypothetical protein